MAAISGQDKVAFGVLMGRHLDPLYAYAIRLSQVASVAEDLTQETWLVAWLKAASYRPAKATVSTWLHRILHNKFVDHSRRERKWTEHFSPNLDELPTTHLNPEQMQSAHQERTELDYAMAQLPVNQQAALLLRHSQGFGNADIGHVMGISIRAVESLLARAKANLKVLLSAQGAKSL